MGARDFKYVGENCPPLRISRIQRIRSGGERIVNGILFPMGDVRTHNSRTDSLKMFKLVEGLTTWPAMYSH